MLKKRMLPTLRKHIILRNNLTAAFAYICLSLLLIMSLYILLFFGLHYTAQRTPGLVIYTVVMILLCIWIGRRYIAVTHNLATDALSVVSVVLLLLVAIPIFFTLPGFANFILYILLIVPIYPISEIASEYLNIELMNSHYVMAGLPSLAMWIGTISKRKVSGNTG